MITNANYTFQVLFGLISHLTFAVKVAEKLSVENAKQSPQRQPRTLGTIAGKIIV